MSPARMAKSLPVMPRVEPPLSVYLKVYVRMGRLWCGGEDRTGRSHVAWVVSAFGELVRRSSQVLR